MGDQNSAFVGPQNLVGYLFDGEIAVFIGENPPKIQIHASTESTPLLLTRFPRGGVLSAKKILFSLYYEYSPILLPPICGAIRSRRSRLESPRSMRNSEVLYVLERTRAH